MPKLEEFITLEQAAEKYNLDKALLTELAEKGKIRGGKLDGTLVLVEGDVRKLATVISRDKVAHLENQRIRLGEAARKYKIDRRNLWRWAQQGYIRKVKGEGKRALWLNEADVAYTRLLIDSFGLKRGKALFAK